MAGREAQVEQTLQTQGIKVTGLKVEDRGEVISIHGSVATESDKQRLEKVVADTMKVKVANHVTAANADTAAAAGTAGAANSELLGQKYTIKSGDTLQKIAKHF